jgi:hypothetical protein
MMFLIRTAFWLTILILLLPTDEGQQNQVYGTASAAVQDVASFCNRNPETCATGRDAFDVLVHKAQYGARMLMDFIKERTGTGEDEDSLFGETAAASDEADAAVEPASWGASQDTLSPEDREVAWGGPGETGT